MYDCHLNENCLNLVQLLTNITLIIIKTSNSRELNKRGAMVMIKNKKNLLNWELNPLQNNLFKLL